MQLTIVKEVPLVASGAFCAINVENNGESAITNHPQTKRNTSKRGAELLNKISGENKQHIPDKNNEMDAIFFAPKLCESSPLNTQAMLPHPMIKKDKNGIFICAAGCCCRYVVSITGTKAQKAYNSHIWPK